MLFYIPEDKEVKRKKLPPEYQEKQKLYTLTWRRFLKAGRYELIVMFLVITFFFVNEIFFTHQFFNYVAIFLNPLSIYGYARIPILIAYLINDWHNQFEMDVDDRKMYFKSGRVISFDDIVEIEFHVGGIFPDIMPSFYQPFSRYKYLGIILASGEKFIITHLIMEKILTFPLEFTFFRDPYPIIKPTKI